MSPSLDDHRVLTLVPNTCGGTAGDYVDLATFAHMCTRLLFTLLCVRHALHEVQSTGTSLLAEVYSPRIFNAFPVDTHAPLAAYTSLGCAGKLASHTLPRVVNIGLRPLCFELGFNPVRRRLLLASCAINARRMLLISQYCRDVGDFHSHSCPAALSFLKVATGCSELVYACLCSAWSHTLLCDSCQEMLRYGGGLVSLLA